jgi:hypothetical protein
MRVIWVFAPMKRLRGRPSNYFDTEQALFDKVSQGLLALAIVLGMSGAGSISTLRDCMVQLSEIRQSRHRPAT